MKDALNYLKAFFRDVKEAAFDETEQDLTRRFEGEAGGLIGSVHIMLGVHLFADAVVLGLRWDMIVTVMEHDLSMKPQHHKQKKAKTLKST